MKIGISPIGWSNDDMPELGAQHSFEQCIEEMAHAGYAGCEVGHKFPRNPKVVLQKLAPYKLQVCNQWFDFRLTTESLESNLERLKPQLEYLQALGSLIIGGGEKGSSCVADPEFPILDYQSNFNIDDFKRYGEKLTRCGELSAAYNLKLAFHSHIGTVIQSIEETELLLEYSDPNYVFINYDSAHFFVGGEDPKEALERTITRVAHVHLKNVRQLIVEQLQHEELSFFQGIMAGLFTVPGDPKGAIDFTLIIQLLHDYNYKDWLVVEADQNPSISNPSEMAKIGFEYINQLLYLCN